MNGDYDNCSMDLLSRKSAYIIWGPPIAFVILASSIINGHSLSANIGGPLVAAGSFWMGIACFINGRRCSRTHCTIDGIAMPIIGVTGLLETIGTLHIPLSYITGAFWFTLLVSYIPEWMGIKYIRVKRGTTKL